MKTPTQNASEYHPNPLSRPALRFPPALHARIAAGLVFVLTALPHSTLATSGTLTNGYTVVDDLTVGGISNAWSFQASNGDHIVIRVGSVDLVNGFQPHISLYDPNSVKVAATNTVRTTPEIALTAATSGTYTFYYNNSVAGSYRVALAKVPGEVFTAPGFSGGPMTNGVTYYGSIASGELDMWTFTATKGDSLVLRMGNTTNSSFVPQIRLYDPSGNLFQSTGGNATTWCELAATATNNGRFTVVVGDGSQTRSGSGQYTFTLAQAPGSVAVAPGDEGGRLNNGVVYTGQLPEGDLDVWDFNACEGDLLTFQVSQIAGPSNFQLALRLYSPSGVLLANLQNAGGQLVSRAAPMCGNYILVISEGTGSAGLYRGSATYQLVASGLTSGFALCRPLVSGTNLILRAVGGTPGSNCVLLATTNLALPLANWTFLHTNQFDAFGTFSLTNLFNPAVKQQFFRARLQ